MPKVRNKKRKVIYKKWLILFVILVVGIGIGYMVFNKFNLKPIYSIDSRINNIKKEQKKDEKDYRTIGWLRVQGTNIDAPIIGYNTRGEEVNVTKDNYLWNEINEKKFYNKVNIMGHNILNLSSTPRVGDVNFSRFDDLMAFVYTDFVEDNKYIQYTVDGKDYLYKIFAVYFDYQFNLNLSYQGNYSKDDLSTYLKKVKKKSIYDFDVNVDSDDKIISLITCTRMFGENSTYELIVNARLVHENEKYTNYDVVENKNYKKIKKILKGDEVNDEA